MALDSIETARKEIAKIYIAAFNRVPDEGGLQNWMNQYTAGLMTYAQISTDFTKQAEYTAAYPSYLTSSEYITEIYQNVFGRNPDEGGLQNWINQIDNTSITGIDKSNVMYKMLQSASATGNTDGLRLTNQATFAVQSVLDDVPTATATAQLANITSDAATVNTATAAVSASTNIGTTYTLTVGVDSGAAFTGTTANDTFNAVDSATAATFTALDAINGGTGTDTLNWTNTVGAITATPAGATVSGIETLNLTSTQNVALNTTAWTGLTTSNTTTAAKIVSMTSAATTNVSVTDTAKAANAVTVQGGKAVTVTVTGDTTGGNILVGATATAPAGAVVISDTDIASTNSTVSSTITVVGGTTVNITGTTTGSGLAVNEDFTQGAFSVTGSSATTAVTATQSAAIAKGVAIGNVANTSNITTGIKGYINGAVAINDLNAANATTATAATLAGTITSVTLANYGAATVSSAALNTLTLSGTGTSIATLEGGSTAATNTTLALNLGGGTLGTITDSSNQFATINTVMSADTTITSITDTALRTINISGTGVLTETTANAAVTAINVTGAAGFSGTIVGTGLTSFTAANTTGNNTVTLTSTTQSYTGGTGNDKVTIAADATQTITGGTGTDTLVLGTGTAGATYTLANTGTKVTGFETLATNAVTGTVDMSLIGGSAFNKIEVAGNSTTTFSKVTAGTALELQAATTAIVYNTSDTAGATDSVAVKLKGTTVTAANGGGTAGYTTTALTLQDANAVGLGNVTITSDASVYQGLHTISTLTDSALSNLTVNGTGSLSITAAATGATSLTIADNGTGASATADGIVTLTASANALGTINYSGTHAFTIGTLADNVANATITNANTGTTGVLTIGTWTDANMANLTLNGSVALTAGTFALNGAASFLGATDNQNVSITAAGGGVKTVTLGNGANTIVTGAAADIITLGTGANTVTGAAGADKIIFAADGVANIDMIKQAAVADSATFAVPGTNTISTVGMDIVTGMQASDKVQLNTAGGGTIAYTGAAAAGAAADNVMVNVLGTATDLSAVTLGQNSVDFVRGTYSSVANTFIGSATGADTLFVYDSNATATTAAYEAIVLVGYAGTTATFSVADVILGA